MSRKIAFASLAAAAALSLSACGKQEPADNTATVGENVSTDELSADENATDGNALGPDAALANGTADGELGNGTAGNATAP